MEAQKKKIFFADDDPLIRRMIRRTIQVKLQDRYDSEEFCSGKEILERISADYSAGNKPGFDMLILDNNMGDGIEKFLGRNIALKAADMYPSLPIRLVTGEVGDYCDLEAKGITIAYKPFPLDKFASWIGSVLG